VKQIMECVPNFSEGRRPEVVEAIVAPFRGKAGVKLLDWQLDADHNRSVVTVVGAPDALGAAVIAAMAVALAQIDMRRHNGAHPRMGAVDVVPFIPVKGVTMEDAVTLATAVGRQAAERFDLPVFLYEAAARRPERVNLADIRKGQFEGMPAKLQDARWRPDFGPPSVHPTAGVTAVGARMPLVAFNVNLGSDNLALARDIAARVRHINGGFRFCKAMGIALADRGQVQVSMNLTDYTRTAVYRVLETIRMEARRHGVPVVGSEIVGLVPLAALVESAAYYMGLENFAVDQILETRLDD
jgi:glutamate formiminotransferase